MSFTMHVHMYVCIGISVLVHVNSYRILSHPPMLVVVEKIQC